MKDLIKKDVEQVIYRTVRGMLPHNSIREHIMANLIVHEGPYHTQFAQKLP
jgi:ribosomal protein L13